ncbi:unnamed protein product [Effrenium voratum]|uniref:Uncharacterized protein n=1 Tax=Effrenium voratum TaxID=2562239 RepID=A0AA36IJ32_9DINO|nr:unnamed protein product [Effrenium voratum]CAJ1423286.1 unnamed protein product [Effrenium voratum]
MLAVAEGGSLQTYREVTMGDRKTGYRLSFVLGPLAVLTSHPKPGRKRNASAQVGWAFLSRMKPQSVAEWFQVVPDLLSRKTWSLACARPQAQLLHRDCPWGGRLVKLHLDGVDLEPGVILRPELWQTYLQQHPEKGMHSELIEVIAPGDAILRTSVDWMPCRLVNTLFGNFEDSVHLALFHGKTMRFRASRDFPQPGDYGCFVAEASEEGPRMERLALMRPANGKYRLVLVWRMVDDHFAGWAKLQFAQLVECLERSYARFFKHLGAREAITLGQNFYVHLSMKHLHSGNPLVPVAHPSARSVEVDVGKKLGLQHWERFGGAFHLAEYLKVFLASMGEEIWIFQSMDGRQLAAHQCVVRADQWHSIKGRFASAFRAQRAAYRRINGGHNAPFFYENGKPELSMVASAPQASAQPETVLVIRNTFWHAQETCRSAKQRRTVSLPLTHLED